LCYHADPCPSSLDSWRAHPHKHARTRTRTRTRKRARTHALSYQSRRDAVFRSLCPLAVFPPPLTPVEEVSRGSNGPRSAAFEPPAPPGGQTAVASTSYRVRQCDLRLSRQPAHLRPHNVRQHLVYSHPVHPLRPKRACPVADVRALRPAPLRSAPPRLYPLPTKSDP
jgi:hypothetical protein